MKPPKRLVSSLSPCEPLDYWGVQGVHGKVYVGLEDLSVSARLAVGVGLGRWGFGLGFT